MSALSMSMNVLTDASFKYADFFARQFTLPLKEDQKEELLTILEVYTDSQIKLSQVGGNYKLIIEYVKIEEDSKLQLSLTKDPDN